MKILLNNKDLNEALNNVLNLGFVPTMGSLHEGHISLIKKSNNQSKKTLVSIFVNPTQFNNKKDFRKYPRNNKKDLKILRKNKVDYVYIPKKNEIYNFRRSKKIKLSQNDKIMCAKSRKGHFEGVLDIMDRLTKLIKPSKIYMGEKDFQQFYLVKKFLKIKYKTRVVLCKTIRNKNRLALSSRNLLLKKNELKKAGRLAKSLISFKKSLKKKNNIKKLINNKKKLINNQFNVKVEYLELRDMHNLKITNKLKNSKLFIAYNLNKIRLIDNF
tara:strand:+ start:26 stop:838 length:813 start_codon:yes stop_codon:yes gene_type:complete